MLVFKFSFIRVLVYGYVFVKRERNNETKRDLKSATLSVCDGRIERRTISFVDFCFMFLRETKEKKNVFLLFL